MMKKVLILRYGEIFLKGNNRGYFERLLIDNIKKSIADIPCKFVRINGRYCIEDYDDNDEHILIEKLQKVFGLVNLSVAYGMESDILTIENNCLIYFDSYYKNIDFNGKTFKVQTKRADKTFPIHSDEFSAHIGSLILNKHPELKVDLKDSNIVLNIDIRENNQTFIFINKIKCGGGMPVGSSGNGLLLLSGGIDSPVAGYKIVKRGMRITALHFHSYPYTSIQAKEKVITLAKKLTDYAGKIKLICVSFTKIQEAIHINCDEEYMITIMRRIMLCIAEKICYQEHLQAIITGESLGQVASQTIESIAVINDVVKKIPILRPLITNDKEETIEIAKKISTFETSILPYEDCCTVFLPKNPIIKPKLSKVELQEEKLNIDDLILEAMNSIEVINL